MGNFNRDDRGGRSFGSRDGGGRGFDRGASRGGFGGGRGGDRPMMHRATCSECGKSCEVPFKPTGSKPVYCSECFGGNSGSDRFESRGRERGNDRSNDRLSFDKKMFSAECDSCGQHCEVPFRPTSGKPVFCDNCFKKSDAGEYSAPKKSNGGHSNGQLDEINAKLDLIIRALGNFPKSNQPSATIITEKAQEKAADKKAKAAKTIAVEVVSEPVKAKKVVKVKAKTEKKASVKDSKKTAKKTGKTKSSK